MKINSVSTNNYNSNNLVKFTGRTRAEALMASVLAENGISAKSSKLVKKLSYLIEEEWAAKRKSGDIMEAPKYLVAGHDGNLVTMRPVYHQYKNTILMEVEGDKYIDRILINRQKPSDYTYERATITPYGSASSKTYDSMRDKNTKIESRVDDYIDKYITSLFNRDDIKLKNRYEGID